VLSALSLSPSTPQPESVDGFEFGVTLNYSTDPNSVRLLRKFGDVVDVRMNEVLLRVSGGATGLWTVELLFDRTSTPYLASGWRRFCQWHEIVASHFLVFNYDDDRQITVTIFDETMCHRHYDAPARDKPTFPPPPPSMTSSHRLLTFISFSSRV
jgi:hypothetical protein